jgi:hypothetical protein
MVLYTSPWCHLVKLVIVFTDIPRILTRQVLQILIFFGHKPIRIGSDKLTLIKLIAVNLRTGYNESQ